MKRVCDTDFRGAQVCDGDGYIVYGLSKRPLEVMAVCTSARATKWSLLKDYAARPKGEIGSHEAREVVRIRGWTETRPMAQAAEMFCERPCGTAMDSSSFDLLIYLARLYPP